ncbi:MAG: bifunctional phosphoribosylaminoimidazolecarboxamide formyltransferase/IMP cyclohydrolase [Rubrobacter sp.]|nr:bifunctional phosphoribosylaminoimidazolecarboxamide formyltransferase/IMP cyclohydrolase [Rubrobacter sp.]
MKRRALVSVSDKTGVVDFVRGLSELGFEVISTGGTAREISASGVEVTPVERVTGSPEILGGRVKTLHPRIHGGILADLEDPDQVMELAEHGIGPVDLVCVNLYPFERTLVESPDLDEKEAIEQIDVGGPAMLRAAAKNFRSVTVVPGPEFYEEVLSEVARGPASEALRRKLALAAFRRTALYDAAISGWLAGQVEGGEESFPERRLAVYEKELPLRYGENPHQSAAYYTVAGEQHLLSDVEKLAGKELSFNNLHDVDAARSVLADLDETGRPAAVIVKHANPCGAAVAGDIEAAYARALASDPTSAFGGIVALNRPVGGDLAGEISKVFTEVLLAPGFTPEAREVFAARPNVALLQAGTLVRSAFASKPVTGGLLLQETDRVEDAAGYETVSGEPSEGQMEDLLFAWRVAKSVKSNAIVLARDGATVGVGAGQMSRVEAAGIAVQKAGERSRGAVAASDAFFPFADGVDSLAEAGVSAIIQPGGSKRDAEVVEAAGREGVAMVLTGRRHFLH